MPYDAKTVTKSGICPSFKTNVLLFANYEKDSSGRLAFSEAHCPIIDNLKKTEGEQDKEFPVEACEDPSKCPLYTGFSDFA